MGRAAGAVRPVPDPWAAGDCLDDAGSGHLADRVVIRVGHVEAAVYRAMCELQACDGCHNARQAHPANSVGRAVRDVQIAVGGVIADAVGVREAGRVAGAIGPTVGADDAGEDADRPRRSDLADHAIVRVGEVDVAGRIGAAEGRSVEDGRRPRKGGDHLGRRHLADCVVPAVRDVEIRTHGAQTARLPETRRVAGSVV